MKGNGIVRRPPVPQANGSALKNAIAPQILYVE
jgi:hypothetical protein